MHLPHWAKVGGPKTTLRYAMFHLAAAFDEQCSLTALASAMGISVQSLSMAMASGRLTVKQAKAVESLFDRDVVKWEWLADPDTLISLSYSQQGA